MTHAFKNPVVDLALGALGAVYGPELFAGLGGTGAAAAGGAGAAGAAGSAAPALFTEGGITSGSAATDAALGLGAGAAGAAAGGAVGAGVSGAGGGTTGGGGSTLSKVLASPTVKSVESAAPTVLGAASLAQEAALQKQALGLQSQAISAQQPALQAANKALQEYAAGTLSGPQEAAIGQWTDQATAQVKQAYANMGLSGSSQEASALAQVQQQAEAQKAQYIQQNFSNAMQALGLSANVYGGITQQELQTAGGMSGALSNLGKALGASGQ